MNPHLADDEEPIDDGVARNAPRVIAAPQSLPTSQPPVEPARPVDGALKWGLVGSRNFRGALSGDWGDEGVVRIVEAGVSYTSPPKESSLREWKQVPNNPQRFEMAWSINPATLRSLEVVGRDLADRPPMTVDDGRLAELDEAVKCLLENARRLHEAKRGIGLLNPRSILLVPDKGGKDLVLPDLGFTWKRGPFKPDWLENAEFKALWDKDAEAQQHLGSAAEGGAPLDTVSDIRTLARLFACVLTGTVQREVAAHPPETARRQTRNPDALARVWTTLAQAARGEFTTVADFAAKLSESPLSQHIFASPPPPLPPTPAKPPQPGPTWIKPAVVGGGILLLVLVILLLWRPWQTGGTGDPKNDGKDSNTGAKGNGGPNKTSVFDDLMEKYARAPPEEKAALLAEMYQQDKLKADAEVKREELRKDFLEKSWIPRFRKAEQISQDLARRFDSGKQVQVLQDELKKLQQKPAANPATNEKEKQCLDFSERRARELGSAP